VIHLISFNVVFDVLIIDDDDDILQLLLQFGYILVGLVIILIVFYV
jgi:hypothetical protein